MRCAVRFTLPHGVPAVLEPGDIIGRSPRVALRLDDPRISELHAYVSLRGTQLVLLALRGRLSVYGKPTSEVPLSPGVRILLAGAFALVVDEVTVPDTVIALEGSGLRTQITGPVSLEIGPPPTLTPGFREAAAAVLWTSGDDLRLRLRGDLDRTLTAGDTFDVDEHRFTVRRLPLDELVLPTTENYGHLIVPLEIALFYDTVHIMPSDGRAVVLDGLVARIVSELAEIAAPIEWQSVARAIWPQVDDLAALRSRWDQAMHRLRRKLREGKIRMDLVRASHGGLYELFLGPADAVRNHS
jgi:hypothetical protein